MKIAFKSLLAITAISIAGFGCLPELPSTTNEPEEQMIESSSTGEVTVPANFRSEIAFPVDALFYYAEVNEDETIGGAMFSTATSIGDAIDFYTNTLGVFGYVLEDTLDSGSVVEAYYTNAESATVVFVTATEGTDGYATVEVLYGPDDY